MSESYVAREGDVFRASVDLVSSSLTKLVRYLEEALYKFSE